MPTRDPHLAAARIVRDAGGTLVGRTRLQKVGYLMRLAGFSNEFNFEYRHYGPYSEELAGGMEIARAFRQVEEKELPTGWGGRYSIYTLTHPAPPEDGRRAAFVQAAKEINAIELELAATAAFLHAVEHKSDPWAETRRRKPDKAGSGRLERAKVAYEALRALDTPVPLPALPGN